MGGGGGSAYIQPDYATATWSGEVWTSATVAGGGSPSNTNGYIVITIIKQYAPSTVIPDDEVNAGELFTFRLSNLRIDD